jgi:XTP/dITP diphosphohydrolase
MKKIIFATGNKAKIAQMRYIVEYFKFPVEIINGKEIYGSDVSYEEEGDTVAEVALNGALEVAKKISLPVIAEDTDLRIEALKGKPGIRAGEFLKNYGREGILDKMKDATDREAVLSSAVVYATPEGESKIFINSIEGEIAKEEKYGDYPDWIAPNLDNSFGGGYNAIFVPKGWNKTLAEISPAKAIPWSYREKNFINVIKYVLTLK